MKQLLVKNCTLFLLLVLTYVACDNNSRLPETFVYQVIDSDGMTLPARIEDDGDGLGILVGRFVFSNTETTFDAVFDYVSLDRTNFSLTDNESLIDVWGSGFYTPDSINFVVTKSVSGIEVEERFTGTR